MILAVISSKFQDPQIIVQQDNFCSFDEDPLFYRFAFWNSLNFVPSYILLKLLRNIWKLLFSETSDTNLYKCKYNLSSKTTSWFSMRNFSHWRARNTLLVFLEQERFNACIFKFSNYLKKNLNLALN